MFSVTAQLNPVHPAPRLQEDLERVRIPSFGWVVNQRLLAPGTQAPILSARAPIEDRYIEEVKTLTGEALQVPWQPQAPVGAKRLLGMSVSNAPESIEVNN